MIKMTGIEIEKINNIDIHLFLEKGMRGGISFQNDILKVMKILTLCIGMQIIYMEGP